MKEQHKDFDDIIRQRLGDFQKDPPVDLWKGIQSGLTTSKGSGLSIPLPGSNVVWIYPVTMSVIIIISALYFALTSMLTSNGYGLKLAELNHSVSKRPVFGSMQNTRHNNGTSIPANISFHQTASNPAIHNAGNQLPEKETLITSTYSDQVFVPEPANSNVANDIFTSNQDTVLFSEIIENLNLIDENQETLIQKNIAKIYQPKNITENSDTCLTNNSLSDAVQKSFPDNLSQGLDPKHDYGKSSGFFVGFGFSPEYNFNTSSEINHWSYGADISLGYERKHFILQTGAGVWFNNSKSEYSIDYGKYESTGNYNYVTTFTIDTIPMYQNDTLFGYIYRPIFHTAVVEIFDTVRHQQIINTNTRLTYLTIPLIAGYSKTFKKCGINIKAGGIFTFMLGKQAKETPFDDDMAKIYSIDNKNPNRSLHQWSFLIIPEFDYYLTHDLSIGVEPWFRYAFVSKNSPENQLGIKPYSIGFKTGIKINF